MKFFLLASAAVLSLTAFASYSQAQIDCSNNWLAFKKLEQHRVNGVCREKSGLEGRDQTAAETARAKANRERNLAKR